MTKVDFVLETNRPEWTPASNASPEGGAYAVGHVMLLSVGAQGATLSFWGIQILGGKRQHSKSSLDMKPLSPGLHISNLSSLTRGLVWVFDF